MRSTARTALTIGMVVVLVATGGPALEDGAAEGGGCPGAMTKTAFTASDPPVLTHLEGTTGPNDGLSAWATPTYELAFWDWREPDSYYVAGWTSQYSCAFQCDPDAATIAVWASELETAVSTGGLDALLMSDPCAIVTGSALGD